MRFNVGTIIILACLLVLLNLNINANTFEKNGWVVISSNTNELVLSFTPQFSGFDSIRTSTGETTLYPRIAGAMESTSSAGNPLVLLARQNITVPSPAGFHIEDIKIEGITHYSGIISPMPTYKYIEGDYETDYVPNYNIYSSFKQSDWYNLTYTGIARDRYIATLNLVTAQFNSVNSSVDIPKKIIIKIKFDSNIASIIINKTSDKEIPTTINYYQTLDWRIPPTSTTLNTKNNQNQLLHTTLDKKWYKISIETEGIYSIDASTLSNNGITISKSDIPTIKIYGNGGAELSENQNDSPKNLMNEQDIIVRTNANGDLDKIIFYGSPAYGFTYDSKNGYYHYLNHYSKDNYYLLTYGGDNGKRAQPITAPQGQVFNYPAYYYQRIFLEEEIYTSFINASGRVWFGRNNFPSTFPTSLPDLVRSQNIFYNFAVAQRSNTYGSFTISENGNTLGTISLGSNTDAYWGRDTATLPASNLSSDNRSYLKFVYNNSDNSSTPYLDWYEIHYPRSFVPINNEIGFLSDTSWHGITEISINGFTGSEIIGFDATNLSNPKLLSNLSTTGGLFVFRDSLAVKMPHRYYITSSFKQPAKIEETDFGNLRSQTSNVDYIIISPPEFLNSAEEYKNYRTGKDSISSVIVRTDDIFNEFGSGIPDPTAIRDFLAFAFNNWANKPKYVLLWGRGHYDYKNIQSQVKNYIPPFESADLDQNQFSENFSSLDSYCADDYFARVKGNDMLIDVAIGRIPVDSDPLGQWIVEKIKHYENSSSSDPWRSMITLLADDSWTSDGNDGNIHSSQSESLSKYYIPSDLQQKKIYLEEYPTEFVPGGRRKPGATDDMVSTINTTGNILLNWIGHGNPRVWAHEELYERSLTTPKMLNMDKLFFTVAATCDFGRFDMPETKCGSEVLLNSDVGGSIGVLSATRSVLSGNNSVFANYFYQDLFTREPNSSKYLRLGDALYLLKQNFWDTNDVKFYLLGDPTMRLLIPDYIVKIDSINGIYVGDNVASVKLQALSNVNISGNIYNPSGTQIDTSFNGTLLLTMRDADVNLTINEPSTSTSYQIQNFGGALNRSSTKVINGNFKLSFIIPKDISYSNDTGRIFAYAYTNNNRYAKGDSRRFTLGGIDSVLDRDTKGPDIALYMDSRDFKAGGYVRNNPLLIIDLYDLSGINATGLGIGHRIEAWIDDSPNSVDLTDKYMTTDTNSKYGTAEQQLFNLTPGYHSVKVRAWDIFNNFSIAETSFIIADSSNGIVIRNLNTFPNPTTNATTTFYFEHNISSPFTAQINIFNTLGDKLQTLTTNINTPYSARIPWNCLDNNGTRLETGVYPYTLLINTNNGGVQNASGIFIFSK